MSDLELAALVATVIGFIPLYVDLIMRRRQEQKVTFRLERLSEKVCEPVESNLAIRVLHPNKAIEKCQVLYNGKLLSCGKIQGVLQYQEYIGAYSGEVFRIPANTENEEALVVVKNGKKKLLQLKFKNVPLGK